MKKQIIILFLLSIQLSAQVPSQYSAQNAKFSKVKVSAPCTQEFIDNYKGKWLVHVNILGNSPDNNFSQEALKRMNEIHNLVTQTYPQPMGSDGNWYGLYTKTYFGYKVKYVTENDRTQMEYATMNPLEGWRYILILYPWSCRGTNEISNIYPEADVGGGIIIDANKLAIVSGEVVEDNIMTIDGRSIKYKMPVFEKWKGYDVLTTEGGANAKLLSTHYVLISRNGMLPYIPVTRKQYLERAIAYVTRTYDQWIKNNESNPDKSTADEYKKNFLKDKNDALKKYNDALEESTKNGLQDSPAIVLTAPMMESLGPIFSTEAQGGRMLVTENPNYYRKDLPKHVPQLFVLSWNWGSQKWCTDFKKVIEGNFPIEKLQEMIDK